MLLHDVRNEDGIRNFFHDVHELYVKVCWPSTRREQGDTSALKCENKIHPQVLMNPFYNVGSTISSTLFDARVKVLGRKYF